MSDWQVPLSALDYGVEEEAAVLRVLRSQWLTMGEEVARFEASFAAAVGADHAVAVSNATAALHLALLAVGVGPGDEVIQPSLNFVAAANMTVLLGARPVFADVISPLEPNIDPAEIERRIGPATKAVVVMHYGGYPCRMAEINALCRRHGVAVVEDACHGPLARYRCPQDREPDGRMVGNLGDVATFSFFGNKNLVTGEGGMLTTQSEQIAEAARLRRSHGMTTVTMDRFKGHAFGYDVACPGFNYRLTEIAAALGQAQLAKLPELTARRVRLTRQYRTLLAERAPQVIVPFQSDPSEPACHLLPVLLPSDCDRGQVMAAMKQEGIQTSIHYRAVHLLSAHRAHGGAHRAHGCAHRAHDGAHRAHDGAHRAHGGGPLPQTEAFSRRELTLPLYPSMTTKQVEQVCTALAAAVPAGVS